MKAAIWIHEFLDKSEQPLTGGVQTYVFELAKVLRECDFEPVLVTRHHRTCSLVCGTEQILALCKREWAAGTIGHTAKRFGFQDTNCINIVANSNCAPRQLGSLTIGIQHGIYWDRPTKQASFLSRIVPTVVNLLRSRRGASAVFKFSKLVCVDLAYPTMAACVFPPLPWDKVVYIPNFAPDVEKPVKPTSKIRRIIFARRLEQHRGTRLFASAVAALIKQGWDGEVWFYGSGSDEAWLRTHFQASPNVKFGKLDFDRRLDAYSEDSLVVIPSLSTEGTSLTCIEAWSKSALVLATCVGGLANLVIDNHNGIMVRPIKEELTIAMARAVNGEFDIERIKATGFATYWDSFTRSRWAERWRKVLLTLAQHPCSENLAR